MDAQVFNIGGGGEFECGLRVGVGGGGEGGLVESDGVVHFLGEGGGLLPC